jgi:NO-binding membrane sensor protein with MHYT domain
MWNLVTCVANEHDTWIVLVAATIALAGMLAYFQLIVRVVETGGTRSRNWCAIASVVAGLSVWSTHFLAMLAYRGPVHVDFDLMFTSFSAILAIVGFWLATRALSLKTPDIPYLAGGAGQPNCHDNAFHRDARHDRAC